ncbi:MAG: universal stress protein uspa-like protein [Candidatus Dadabacteria bacterium CSP1-2]|nr:MAG: universal stress protein uspa-like protein [Candidatus Dadabacteria bacterium CSP1-2]
MIHKILWASDGSKDSIQALKHAELMAKKLKAQILSLLVIPDYYDVAEKFPPDEKQRFAKWIEETTTKERKVLEDIGKDFKEKGINFKIEITSGIPYRQILKVADREKVDLIALGKGRAFERSILGGTALKVLRSSTLPVLTARGDGKSLEIKRILVPTDLSHVLSKDLNYAVELSEVFGATIYLLNIVEVGEHAFPPEIVEQMRGFAYREIVESMGKVKIKENIEASVEVAKNAWRGIVGFANEGDIDLIVMMSYGGGKLKEDFIGSVAEKVIQESASPVITMTP